MHREHLGTSLCQHARIGFGQVRNVLCVKGVDRIGVRVYYCRSCCKAVRVGGGDSGGHLLQETTSRGRSGLVCPSRTSGGEEEGGGARSEPGEARTILLLHIISFGPSQQPLMVRTFFKVHMEFGSYFVALRTNKRHHHQASLSR